MATKKHIPPDVLMRIGDLYVEFLDAMTRAFVLGASREHREAHKLAAERLDKAYGARFHHSIAPDGEDLPKRFFAVDAGATYTVVAFDYDHAWVLFALEVARTECGGDTESASLRELTDEEVAKKHVNDERDGREGRYPLASAEVGDVFCSEY